MADKQKLILCPYCGNTQTEPEDRCMSCGGFFDSLSLKVSQQAMGPWFIRDRHMPYRPGCSFEVLRKQIEKGKIKPTTIIRGPTTRQFWSVARNIPGVAHLLGYCHACGEHVNSDIDSCDNCGEIFFLPKLRDQLGLAPQDPAIHAEAVRAQQQATAASGQTGVTLKDTVTSSDVHNAVGSGILANLRLPDPIADATLTDGGPLPSARPAQSVTLPAQQRQPTTTPPVPPSNPDDAMRWMTGQGDDEPDNLENASDAIYQPSRSGGQSTTTWLLVGLNVLLVLAFIAVVVFIVLRQPPNNPPASNQPNNPNNNQPTTPGDSSNVVGANDPGSMSVTSVSPMPIIPINPTPSPTTTANAQASQTPTPPAVNNPWAEMFQRAQRLQQLGDYEQAAEILANIDLQAPGSLRPNDLAGAIEQVRQAIHRQQVERYLLASASRPEGGGEIPMQPTVSAADNNATEMTLPPIPDTSTQNNIPQRDNIFTAPAVGNETDRQKVNWSHRYAEALVLRLEGKHAEALKILEEIAKLPANQQPDGFRETYQQTRNQVGRK